MTGDTALTIAAFNGNLLTYWIGIIGRRKFLLYLLYNHQTNHGWTPLMFAVKFDKKEIVQIHKSKITMETYHHILLMIQKLKIEKKTHVFFQNQTF